MNTTPTMTTSPVTDCINTARAWFTDSSRSATVSLDRSASLNGSRSPDSHRAPGTSSPHRASTTAAAVSSTHLRA
ncbi:hypothetical protein, partial [Actinomadura geliboluensis]|uniref:hypothetical protein n=1 Tax=Actinomadura geliboluensis TaxID=882440 RepID=UPI00197AA3E2